MHATNKPGVLVDGAGLVLRALRSGVKSYGQRTIIATSVARSGSAP